MWPQRSRQASVSTCWWVLKSSTSREGLGTETVTCTDRAAARSVRRSRPLPLFTAACLAELDSLDYHEERLPLFDNIRRELGRVAAADVPDRVDRLGRKPRAARTAVRAAHPSD